MRVLFISEGRKSLAQMAAAYLSSIDKKHDVASAITGSKKFLNKHAIMVMDEIEIPIKDIEVINVDEYTDEAFTYIVTLCQESYESRPFFTGKIHNSVHILIYDFEPSLTEDEDYTLSEFRKVREDMKEKIGEFYNKHLKEVKMPEFTFKMPHANVDRKDLKEILKKN